ncbi:MAG: M14 family metallopeptidase [Acidobacteriota bacterium]
MKSWGRKTAIRLTNWTVAVALSSTVGLAEAPSRDPSPIPAELLTVAEQSDFRATSTYDQTIAFVERLVERSPLLELSYYGESGEGRPLPVVVYSSHRSFQPRPGVAPEKPIVMIQNGIHGGEIDGKDASLMLLRDLVLGRLPELQDAATLVVLPIYNVDGHERMSPFNRPNQNGPVDGMGFRTNTAGFDLNRDHLKVATPEGRAVIALFNHWRPHLHIDNHVTDGSDHDWVLTWSWAEGPQIAPSVATWLEDHMPAALAATAAAGHRIGPYISLKNPDDPSQGFSSRVAEPRFATGYYPLRHRPSLLVENHSYKPYEARVRANFDFMVAVLAEVGRSGRRLIAAVTNAESRTVRQGRPGAEPSEIVITWRERAPADRHRVPFYEWYQEPSQAMGRPLTHFRRGEIREVEVPWVHASEPDRTAPRPRGYLVMPGWPVIAERIAAHGLRSQTFRRAVVVSGETLRVSNPTYASASYQGQTRVEADLERRQEDIEVPAGALWIPAAQPDFEVAVQLLEPQAPDSLFAWGYLSSVLERKEYIEPRVLEPLVREMLADDAIAAEWQRALDEDPDLAGNAWARWQWWYRRTPYWDARFGVLPIVAVGEGGLAAVTAGLALETRSPGAPDTASAAGAEVPR